MAKKKNLTVGTVVFKDGFGYGTGVVKKIDPTDNEAYYLVCFGEGTDDKTLIWFSKREGNRLKVLHYALFQATFDSQSQ